MKIESATAKHYRVKGASMFGEIRRQFLLCGFSKESAETAVMNAKKAISEELGRSVEGLE